MSDGGVLDVDVDATDNTAAVSVSSSSSSSSSSTTFCEDVVGANTTDDDAAAAGPITPEEPATPASSSPSSSRFLSLCEMTPRPSSPSSLTPQQQREQATMSPTHTRKVHVLTCHCGSVELNVTLVNGFTGMRRCDCSLCRRRGAVCASAWLDDVVITRGEHNLTLYQFGTRTAKHYFCHICGIYTHHQRRSNPLQYGVNVGAIVGVNPRHFRHEDIPWVDGVSHPRDRDGGNGGDGGDGDGGDHGGGGGGGGADDVDEVSQADDHDGNIGISGDSAEFGLSSLF